MITSTHLGHYNVNGKFFTEKIDAILYANTTLADITWEFHDNIYNNINWTVEPEPSMDDFYKMRAQQIRDQYDYVIVLCSGGGDSTNVIYSFLNNNILIDEIIASAPITGLDKWKHQTKDNAADNTISETLYAQLPLINTIKQEFPHIKVTINDYFEAMTEFKTDDWLFRAGEWIHPTSGARYNLEKLTHIRALADQGKKIGIVYGIDKPTLVLEADSTISMLMSDRAVSVQRPAFDTFYPNVDNVLFYYSPDMPLMQVKQCHMLARWLHRPENAVALQYTANAAKRLPSHEANRRRNSLYERAIIPCIYPATYRPVFQGHKPTRMFLGEHDAWFYQLHGNTRMYEMIDSDFRNFYNTIDDKYFAENKTGFKVFIQKHQIGNVSNFTPLVLT